MREGGTAGGREEGVCFGRIAFVVELGVRLSLLWRFRCAFYGCFWLNWAFCFCFGGVNVRVVDFDEFDCFACYFTYLFILFIVLYVLATYL